jgi:hypothetical protein
MLPTITCHEETDVARANGREVADTALSFVNRYVTP